MAFMVVNGVKNVVVDVEFVVVSQGLCWSRLRILSVVKLCSDSLNVEQSRIEKYRPV